MRRRLLGLAVCAALAVGLPPRAWGQRLIAHQLSWEVYGGVPLPAGRALLMRDQRTVGAQVGFYLRHYDYLFGFAEYEREGLPFGAAYRVPSRAYLGGVGYLYPLASDAGKNVLLYAGLSGHLGYEQLNDGRFDLPYRSRLRQVAGFVYGPSLQLSVECFLCDWLLLTLRGQARYLFGATTGGFRPAATLGLRLNPGSLFML